MDSVAGASTTCWRNLYLHWPFCRRKCDYCAFYSEAGVSQKLRTRYFHFMLEELRRFPRTGTARLESVYLGGGTPTLLETEELIELGSVIAALPLVPGAEISVEANPETLDETKAAALASFANRLSVGVQSFREAKRRFLGRECSDAAIDRALALGNNFPEFSCDLIYHAQGESLEDWQDELERALNLPGLTHLSSYSLTVEENTRLAARLGKTFQGDDDLDCDMWRQAGKTAAAHGFERYEISNYAREGHRCRHNANIWKGDTYFGLGAGAASFDGGNRFRQVESIEKFLAGAAPEVDQISPEARLREIAAMELRTSDGWGDDPFWRQRFPALWTNERECAILHDYRSLARQQLSWFGRDYRLTEEGMLFWNTVAEGLI
ncbi:MAG: radical SAM family heme chaperone HemW [Victivallaceae bacterium]|nr:radical SAM family heme chaperone HemW [Victivallaceae bacterium]